MRKLCGAFVPNSAVLTQVLKITSSLQERRDAAVKLLRRIATLNQVVDGADRSRVENNEEEVMAMPLDKLKKFISSKKQIVKRMEAAADKKAAKFEQSPKRYKTASPPHVLPSPALVSQALVDRRIVAKNLLRDLELESAHSSYKAKATITEQEVDELDEAELKSLIRNKKTILARVRDPDAWRERCKMNRATSGSADGALRNGSAASDNDDDDDVDADSNEDDNDDAVRIDELALPRPRGAFMPLDVLLAAAGMAAS